MKNKESKQDIEKRYPLIIGFSGISGAGKSTLIKRLKPTLQATAIFWDEYDDISQAPQDYVKWFQTSKNYDDWIYPKLADTLSRLKKGQQVICPATQRVLEPTKYILFDAPLGYCHRETGKYIDYLICLDTSPDIALARRLLRDYHNHLNIKKIMDELESYLSETRPLFILSEEEKNCDLLLDGNIPLQKQEQQVLSALSTLRRS